MDLSDVVNYVTIGLWVFGAVSWVARIARGEKPVPKWLRLLSSNAILGIIIFLGLTGSILALPT